ncbi:MAG: hypothetical protein M1821_006921 [Bathelium mastoideum]|nr:MAG: hypothetical protein M1821_006921 [Bathelium mastoideum]
MTEPTQPTSASPEGPPAPAASSPAPPDSPRDNAQTTVAHETPDSPSSNQFISRARASTTASLGSATSSFRRGTLRLLDADLPLGMWAATAQTTSQAPTLGDIRSGRVGRQGSLVGEEVRGEWERRRSSVEGVGGRVRTGTNSSFEVPTPGAHSKRSRARTNSSLSMGTPKSGAKRQGSFGFGVGKASGDDLAATPGSFPSVKEHEEEANHGIVEELRGESSIENADTKKAPLTEEELAQLPSGYIEPPKLPWTVSTIIGLKAFWRWFITPLGFLITIYGLNVVAWGGMLFLLLCDASPAMCHPTCNDINSPRRIWIEIDSQILNALFCVTGFGLIPWRFRDWWWLLYYRLGKRVEGLRRLAGIHRSWFRLKGSDFQDEVPENERLPDEENLALPIPLSKKPDPPLTGVRAPPTATWKLDFVIWCNVLNTFLQACLCGFMWGLNRYNRPSWATGFFIAIACVVAGMGGIMMFVEGKKVKRVEGVPVKFGQTLKDVEKAEKEEGKEFQDDKIQSSFRTRESGSDDTMELQGTSALSSKNQEKDKDAG